MSNEIIKYHSEMNTIPFKSFTALEMDLFFSIVGRMRNEDTNLVRFSFEEIRELSRFTQTSDKVFVDTLVSMYDKLMTLSGGLRTKTMIIKFALFPKFIVDLVAKTVDVSVAEEFKYILNDIDVFTAFTLQEFVSLRSSYAKTMFRLLKEFKGTGFKRFTMDDFKEQFDVPKSYRMTDITKKVLEPIESELSGIYQIFDIKKRKLEKGNKITHIDVIFDKESSLTRFEGERYLMGIHNNIFMNDDEVQDIMKKFRKSIIHEVSEWKHAHNNTDNSSDHSLCCRFGINKTKWNERQTSTHSN